MFISVDDVFQSAFLGQGAVYDNSSQACQLFPQLHVFSAVFFCHMLATPRGFFLVATGGRAAVAVPLESFSTAGRTS